MLAEERKWRLERGLSLLENGYYSCKDCPNHTDEKNMWTGHCWIEEGSFCPVEYSDFRDAAEFEARVAARLTHSHEDLTGCDGFDATCHSETLTCWECRLKYARLAVEQEMENGRTF